jgi:hypothetical protein
MFDTALELRCEARPDSERFYVAVVTAKSIAWRMRRLWERGHEVNIDSVRRD